MNFLIGLLVGLFIYGTIMYFLYWGDFIGAYCLIYGDAKIFIYILIGLGWVWFIPHFLFSIIRKAVERIRWKIVRIMAKM